MILKYFRKYALISLLALSISIPQAAEAASSSTTGTTTNEATNTSDLTTLQEVLNYLETYNIEGVDRKEFLDSAIRGMVYSLDDPYSDYFSSEELQKFENGLNQEYVGIGVTLRYHDHKLYVTDVLASSPAAAAGLRQNDIITKVDGQAIASQEDTAKIQGKENTQVQITVNRSGKSLTLSINRAHFALPSVTGKMIPSSKVGYIAISTFSETADDEFATKLAQLRKEGIASLVLDLRDNLGGYVESAANIAKHFMKNGILMYTSDQSNELQPVTITDGEDIGMPVVVLTNGLTASASEILTGSLRDNGLATVIGSQTYGKARIQNLFKLSNGSSLKLTVQKYLTPNKEDFNHIGLKPDITVKNSTAAQLITGLYKSGVRKVEVSGSPSSLYVNGAPFAGYVDVLQTGGKTYVPSQIVAALIQGKAEWTPSLKKLTLTDKNGKRTGYTVAAKSTKIVGNESFIELHDLKQKVPNLTWSYQQGILKLSLN
ncbi:S41 family peptidase [Paenibacillus puldeungensis]|uniref:S41 family peptidase n=1 Tax=Paenibacillus puldeungensis TaxID=696536 RepID=A0ABW3S2H1_9BACL